MTNKIEDKIGFYSDPKCSKPVESLKWQVLKDSFSLEIWARNESDKHDFYVQDLIHDDEKIDVTLSSDVLFHGQTIKIMFRYWKTPNKIIDVPICSGFTLNGYFKKIEITKEGSTGGQLPHFEDGSPVETYRDLGRKLHEDVLKLTEKKKDGQKD